MLGHGVDAYGEPLEVPHGAGFRALLLARRFEDLCAHVTSLQESFESDVTRERWPYEAIEGISAVSPSASGIFDEWIAATPDCFVAHASRGYFLFRLGAAQRGTATAARTPPARFAAARVTNTRAEVDLRRALELRPRVVIAATALITMLASLSEGDGSRDVFDAAIRQCPDCMEPRIAYLRAMRPRWADDQSQVTAVLDAVDASRRPALAVLEAFPDYDDCFELRTANRLEDALVACNAAIAARPHWRWYLERGRVHEARADHDRALSDFDEALRLRPNNYSVLTERVDALIELDRREEAIDQLASLAQAAPMDPRVPNLARRIIPDLYQRIMREHRTPGHQAEEARARQILEDVLPPGDQQRTMPFALPPRTEP